MGLVKTALACCAINNLTGPKRVHRTRAVHRRHPRYLRRRRRRPGVTVTL